MPIRTTHTNTHATAGRVCRCVETRNLVCCAEGITVLERLCTNDNYLQHVRLSTRPRGPRLLTDAPMSPPSPPIRPRAAPRQAPAACAMGALQPQIFNGNSGVQGGRGLTEPTAASQFLMDDVWAWFAGIGCLSTSGRPGYAVLDDAHMGDATGTAGTHQLDANWTPMAHQWHTSGPPPMPNAMLLCGQGLDGGRNWWFLC